MPERRVKRRPKHVIITALRYVLAVTDTQPMHDFDVALSYTSEDRHYVQQVAEGLRDIGVRVFYDEFAAVELWGADLYTYLDEVYRKRARFTVVFVSRNYAAKEWTAHERQSAQARAMNELGPYLLPVRLDSEVISARNQRSQVFPQVEDGSLATARSVVSPDRLACRCAFTGRAWDPGIFLLRSPQCRASGLAADSRLPRCIQHQARAAREHDPSKDRHQRRTAGKKRGRPGSR